MVPGLCLRMKPTCRAEPGAEWHNSVQVPRKMAAGGTYPTDCLISNTRLSNLPEDPDYSWMSLIIKSRPITLACRWNTCIGHAGSGAYHVKGMWKKSEIPK